MPSFGDGFVRARRARDGGMLLTAFGSSKAKRLKALGSYLKGVEESRRPVVLVNVADPAASSPMRTKSTPPDFVFFIYRTQALVNEQDRLEEVSIRCSRTCTEGVRKDPLAEAVCLKGVGNMLPGRKALEQSVKSLAKTEFLVWISDRAHVSLCDTDQQCTMPPTPGEFSKKVILALRMVRAPEEETVSHPVWRNSSLEYRSGRGSSQDETQDVSRCWEMSLPSLGLTEKELDEQLGAWHRGLPNEKLVSFIRRQAKNIPGLSITSKGLIAAAVLVESCEGNQS